jgi:hypothetical protein
MHSNEVNKTAKIAWQRINIFRASGRNLVNYRSRNRPETQTAGLVWLKVGISSCHRFRLAFVIRILSNVNVCSVDGSLKIFIYDRVKSRHFLH